MADTDVTLKIGLDVKDVESQAQQLRGKIENVFDKTNGKKMSSSFVHLKQSMRDVYTESEQVSKNLANLTKQGNVKVPTEEYAKWAKEAQKVGTKLQELQAKLNYFRNMPGGIGLQKPEYATTLRAFNKYQTLAGIAQTQMQNLKASGKAFTIVPVEQTQQYQDLIARQSQLNDKMQIANTRAQEMQNKMSGVKEAFTSARNAVSKIGQAIRKLISLAGRLVDRLRGVNTGVEDTSKSMKNLLKFALKYGLGLRSLFILYKRLRSAGVEAYKGLASQFPELQAELNDLKNSFFQLKNSLATMAQPILSYLVPAIKTLMSWLTAAMNAIANFFAILTGAKYIYKASKANKDWAKSAGGAGKAAKEASEDIAEYDNLILIQQDNDNGGGGGGGAADDYAGAFEKVKAESDLAKEIKDAINRGDWEGVGVALGKRLNTVTAKLDNWINTKFRPAAKKWAGRVAQILNGLTDTWDSALTGKTLADGLMAVYDTIATFYEKYNFKNLGKKVGTAITSFFTSWEPDTVARRFAGKFNAVINFVAGLIDKEKGINFKLIGQKLGETLRRTIERIEWKQLGADLSGLATGILESLASFIKESKVGTTVGNAINEFLSGIDFGQLAKDLSDVAINIMDAIADLLETIDWTAMGQAIADFLKNIDWGKFLETLAKVALALVKGLGTALLQIATDPEALGSIATGLLAIFGAKWIWGKITGIFKTGLTDAITQGAASAGGGSAVGGWLRNLFTSQLGSGGIATTIGQGLIGGLATYQGVGSIYGNVNSVIATIFNNNELAAEYQKFSKNAIGYTKQAISDCVSAANEMSDLTGQTTLSNALAAMFSDGGNIDKALEDFSKKQEKLQAEGYDAYIRMIEKRIQAGKKVNAQDLQLVAEYRGKSIDAYNDIESASNHYATIAQQNAKNVGASRKEAIDSSNHYAQVAKQNSITHQTAEKAAENASTHHAQIAKANAGVVSESQKAMTDASNHYAAVAKQNAQVHITSEKQMEQASNHHAEIAKTNAGVQERIRQDAINSSNHYVQIAQANNKKVETSVSTLSSVAGNKYAKMGTDAINSSAVMQKAYQDGTKKSQDAFSGMQGAYEGMTNGIKASVSTIPDSFSNTFTNAYNKVTSAFSSTNTFFSGVAEGVKSPFSTMADYFKTTFTNSWTGVTNVFKTNSPQFQTIQDSVSNTFKSAINSMIGGINNSLLSPFRTLSNAFSRMKGFSINGASPFSGLPSFNVPNIPKLAQGAVLPPNSPFLAVVGDQKSGTNVEAPLDTIVQALQIALENNNNNQPIILNLNGRQVAQAVWDEENKRYKQTGQRFRYS